jgi:fatty-acyl-CoA synthase
MKDFDNTLKKNKANYVPLNPVSFLRKTAATFPSKKSIVYYNRTYSWLETYSRCKRLASALVLRGLDAGDTVGFIAMNTPELYEAHFGVPMAGFILNAMNYRLDPKTLAFIIDHSETKLLVADLEFLPSVEKAVSMSHVSPEIIVIEDIEAGFENTSKYEDYEELLSTGDPDYCEFTIQDEWETISINYTSGTTGNPKGVAYHYRGAYLNAIGNVLEWEMDSHPVYLWTLPMFHCNGWCFPWTIAAKAGTNVCLRKVTANQMYASIAQNKVDHLCGAPIVLSMLADASEKEKIPFNHLCKVMTAAAPPPASVLEAMQELGFQVTHVYGLTEVYGPCVVCAWDPDWNNLSIKEQAEIKSRQGVSYVVQEGIKVVNQSNKVDVPRDGRTIGEVLLRGNITMKGYLKNPEATEEAFSGGWFHTGDLGVMFENGYVQLKDRAKDIIISGGENISSIEIENCIYRLEQVAACGVVAMKDNKWGEVPCVFVELKPDCTLSKQTIIKHCKSSLASFKVPKEVIFQELPKTSTGKIQKVELRKIIPEGG